MRCLSSDSAGIQKFSTPKLGFKGYVFSKQIHIGHIGECIYWIILRSQGAKSHLTVCFWSVFNDGSV